MTCRDAERLAAASHPGADHGALASHLASCPGCRRHHAGLAAGLEQWRQEFAALPIPPTEREWHAVRRARRSGTGSENPLLRWFAWSTAPLTAVAAYALLAYAPPARWTSPQGQAIAQTTAITSSAVFVDSQTGWLVVWANEPGAAVSQ